MNRFLPTKSKLLGTLFILSLFTINWSHAQIVHVNLPEDTPIPAHIDFDTDGNPEFDIDNTGTYISYFNYGQANNIHAIGDLDTGNWDVPACVSAGFEIGPDNNWSGQGDASLDGWGAGNPTLTLNTDEYLAVRFNLSGSTAVYYGWIHFVMDEAGNITYLDYAYNSTADTPIEAGQTEDMGVHKELRAQLQIYPNPFQNKIHFTTQGNTFSYRIVTLEGKTLQHGATSSGILDLSTLQSGMYFLQLTNPKTGKRLTTRLLKK